jgi:arylsulfatase A-like enzyme
MIELYQRVFFSVTLVGVLTIPVGIASAAPNILLIIGDDMGVETLASYGIGDKPPATAALDQMTREGVRFANVWSQPIRT